MLQLEKLLVRSSKERRGDFGGGTVQVIPHITNEIKSRFYRNPAATDTEIAILKLVVQSVTSKASLSRIHSSVSA